MGSWMKIDSQWFFGFFFLLLVLILFETKKFQCRLLCVECVSDCVPCVESPERGWPAPPNARFIFPKCGH